MHTKGYRYLFPLFGSLLSLLQSGCTIVGPNVTPTTDFTVEAIHDLGPVSTSSTIRGRDGGYSAVWGNRSIWVFGDTFINVEAEDGSTFLSNTWSWTTDLDASDSLQELTERRDTVGAPALFFRPTTTEHAFNQRHLSNNCQAEPCGARWALWPGALVYDSTQNRMLAFYQKIYAEPGSFNFRGVGYGIALWEDFDSPVTRPVIDASAEHPTLLFQADEPAFGSATFMADDLLYVYGCKQEGFDKPCYLGRVSPARILDRSTWSYYQGPQQWTATLSEAIPLFSGNDIISISYNAYLEHYLAVYSRPLGRTVVARTATTPEGPWSPEVPLFEAEAPTNELGWIYDALAHAEYQQENGQTIYISYSRETDFLAFEMRLVKVELRVQ